MAQVDALARVGRGQTVLDVVDTALGDALRQGQTSAVGRLAAVLLRAAGTWPWVNFGADPGPLLTRLHGLVTVCAGDPAAQARVLAALSVGSCYDPDPGVPDTLSRQALALAEGLGDPEVLADALLARVQAYVGVPGHVAEAEELLARLAALARPNADVDRVLRHSALTMCRLISGDVVGAANHLRLGAEGSDTLRLPVLRAQLRWMEFTLAQWGGGPEAEELFDQALQAHRRTELYEGGVGEFALHLLRWDQGRLVELPRFTNEVERLTWRAVEAAAQGRRAEAASYVGQRLADGRPDIWLTLGHLTLLGHVVADLGLSEHVDPLVDRLQPHRARVAAVGQVGVAGPVALALARLELLRGDLTAARRDLDTATEISLRNQGRPWRLRCRLLEVELDLAAGVTDRPYADELTQIGAEARDLGLQGVERAVAEMSRAGARPG